MTTIAGVDVHAEATAAVRGILPSMTLKQNGVDVSGEGLVDGDIATFISRTITRPEEGDYIEFSGLLRVVTEVGGTEDAWTLSLSTMVVPALDPTDTFDFRVEAVGTGRILLLRLDAGRATVKGQWRNGNGAWYGFSMDGRNIIVETGEGEIEISAYRVNADGTSTEPLNRKVTAT